MECEPLRSSMKVAHSPAARAELTAGPSVGRPSAVQIRSSQWAATDLESAAGFLGSRFLQHTVCRLRLTPDVEQAEAVPRSHRLLPVEPDRERDAGRAVHGEAAPQHVGLPLGPEPVGGIAPFAYDDR